MAVARTKFPLFDSAPYVECILRPGEMLYIPVSERLSIAVPGTKLGLLRPSATSASKGYLICA